MLRGGRWLRSRSPARDTAAGTGGAPGRAWWLPGCGPCGQVVREALSGELSRATCGAPSGRRRVRRARCGRRVLGQDYQLPRRVVDRGGTHQDHRVGHAARSDRLLDRPWPAGNCAAVRKRRIGGRRIAGNAVIWPGLVAWPTGLSRCRCSGERQRLARGAGRDGKLVERPRGLDAGVQGNTVCLVQHPASGDGSSRERARYVVVLGQRPCWHVEPPGLVGCFHGVHVGLREAGQGVNRLVYCCHDGSDRARSGCQCHRVPQRRAAGMGRCPERVIPDEAAHAEH